MVNSWIQRVVVLLLTILLVLSAFLIWTNFNYNAQLRETVIRENANTATVWSNSVEASLNNLYEHVYDLLLTIYNNTELGRGTPMMRIEVQQRVLDMMGDKLIASSRASCFFVQDGDDLFLFTAKSGIPNREASALKAFARGVAEEDADPLNDKIWTVAVMDGKTYFVKIIVLGKYMVGAASRIGYYDIQSDLSVLGEEVSCMLEKDGQVYYCSGEDWTADLILDQKGYSFDDRRVVTAVPFRAADATTILAVRNGTFLENINNRSAAVLLFCSVVCLGLILYLFFFLNKQVLRPTRTLLKANSEIASGNIDYRLEVPGCNDEFAELFVSFNSMADQIRTLRIDAYDHLLQQRENQLRMLRAQIKPHFYLNAITTITNMTYLNKPEIIRAYITGLARHLRYMMNTQSKWTTVEEEISHIRNYIRMQELRFPGSILEDIHYDPDTAGTQIPMLMLFTLVENSFKHALTLYEPLRITVRCERIRKEDFTGIRIVEEDSGDGFSQEVLDMIRSENPPAFTKEHLGLNNVRYTLNLTYHRSNLLQLRNREGGGAHVELWIPEEENHETADM